MSKRTLLQQLYDYSDIFCYSEDDNNFIKTVMPVKERRVVAKHIRKYISDQDDTSETYMSFLNAVDACQTEAAGDKLIAAKVDLRKFKTIKLNGFEYSISDSYFKSSSKVR
ncbi:unnamed protein product [Ambrosiozyma monospora]|uniref:Unnamed protein product n=1 Tax=Ambrosiozyma monospora TaxID=43982 RepID=A0A9W6YTK7_AMBMO|nr:unnamed protein product [Ambrosiozyma monospora]